MRRLLFILLFSTFLSFPGFNQNVTNLGTDFWIAFPPNLGGSTTLSLYIASNFSTSGLITSAFPGVNQGFTVVPGIVTQISIPNGVALSSLIPIEDKGIHITSNDPIAVYALNYQSASTDAYMALPVNALGNDYRILTYKTTISNNGSCFSVVATADGTELIIFNHQTNATSNVSLNQGQTYHLESTAVGDDLTGSRIQSNFPVAVYASVDGVNITSTCTFADHIVEQLFPYYSWGKNFVTVPLAGRGTTGDIFRISAAEDGTTISVNGTTVATINEGDYYETNLTGYNSIQTSKASILAQYAKGTSCSGASIGDPFMMQIFPREQFLTNYTIINVTNFASHWVNLVAPDYALGTIYEDGALVPNGAFTQIGTTNYYGAQRSVSVGSHTYTGAFPFGVFVYGWNSVNSYGYPGGGSLSPVGTVDSVSISPDTSYGELNVTNICLTAHVLDNLNNPVEGVLVNFNVSGVSILVGNAYTNATGDAEYCYTQMGSTAGMDEVYAEVFGFLSDTAVVFWSNAPCANPTSGGTITGNQSGCGTYNPSPITTVILPTGQVGSLEYKWQSSIIGAGSGFVDIPSSNTPGYTPGTISQTTWYKRLARVSCMGDWVGAAESNVVELTAMTPLPVSLSISESNNNQCEGTLITYTASPTHGGSSPFYQWKVNGINSGSNSVNYSYVPLNGDLVTCVMTSNEVCTTGNPATSNTIQMVVIPKLPVSCSVSASENPVCAGTTVTYLAASVNGGTAPSFQWKVNGVNVGASFSSYSYVPVNGDLVSCVFTSSLQCTVLNPVSSNQYPVSVNPLPIVTFISCFDTMTTTNAKPIKLKGGIPLGGTYTGPAVSNGVFYPNLAGVGSKTITYSYTNAALCSSSDQLRIHMSTSSTITCGNKLTDIRDSRQYNTVAIGTQCWMAENLNYGNPVSSIQHQRDNCLNEKYCYQDLNANCEQRGANYQWDELMRYDDTPGLQGLCPPAWHVPTDAEWNLLFANFTNSGFAGSPLKYDGYSGFAAFLSGAQFMNRGWYLMDLAALFWTSTSYGPNKAWSHGMNDYNPSVSLYPSSKANAFFVRCLKDN